jgi:hypothetical protein
MGRPDRSHGREGAVRARASAATPTIVPDATPISCKRTPSIAPPYPIWQPPPRGRRGHAACIAVYPRWRMRLECGLVPVRQHQELDLVLELEPSQRLPRTPPRSALRDLGCRKGKPGCSRPGLHGPVALQRPAPRGRWRALLAAGSFRARAAPRARAAGSVPSGSGPEAAQRALRCTAGVAGGLGLWGAPRFAGARAGAASCGHGRGVSRGWAPCGGLVLPNKALQLTAGVGGVQSGCRPPPGRWRDAPPAAERW